MSSAASFYPAFEAPLTGGGASVSTASELLDTLPVGIAVFRHGAADQPVCVQANRLFYEWSGIASPGLIGVSPRKISVLCDQGSLIEQIAEVIAGGQAGRGEHSWSVQTQTGIQHFAAQVAVQKTRSGQQAVLCVRDRSPEIYAEAHLRQTMLSDDLTGIPNRLSFMEKLEAELERAGRQGLVVLLLNVDRFTRINESLGATVGDEFLIALARRLTGCVRDRDCVARLGADEFAILLPTVNTEAGANEVVERIHQRLEDPFTLSGGEVYASATIGIAIAEEVGTTAEELIHQADYALRSAKSAGANAVEKYVARDHSREIGLFHMEAELRRAIEREELTLAYQPLVSLETGRIVGVEALSRWHNPERGFVSPGDYIPIAEESGLIVPLGRAALRHACERLAYWRKTIKAAADMHIAVNVSGVQLKRDDIVATVHDALSNAGLPGSALKIELTESAIVSDPERIREVFHRLKALGCKIAMDDFGTGYSSLAYLQTFPIDVLKIDQSFIAGMLDSEDSQNIIDAILSLSRALHMTTVAEGIETELQMRAIRAAGCDIGQGYYFARPLSEPDLIAKLGQRS